MSRGTALPVWSWPSWPGVAWMVAGGGLGSMGHLCYVRAFSMADASAIMPYDYVRLLFAALIGWIFFAEVPDQWTLVGAVVIAGSAIYIAHREAVHRHAAAPAAADPGIPPSLR